MTIPIGRRRFVAGLAASCGALALAGPAQGAARLPRTPEQRTGRLLAGIDRTESLRAIRAVQARLAQCIHFGLWDDAGELFGADGLLEWDGARAAGAEAVAGYLRTALGGSGGRPAGMLHTQLLATPVITLDPAGELARGRWHEVRMASGEQAWAASLLTADYVREEGRWLIGRLTSHPIFAGSYAEGWRNVVPDLPVIPYAFTPLSTGLPASAGDGEPVSPDKLAEAWPRLAALEAEDAARNLQAIYGYYLDRRMWDDVADLFTPDGILAIEGIGRFKGRKAIRAALERQGPAGLRHGELYDHPQFNTTVAVSSSTAEAQVRGLELGMVGRNGADAWWTLTSFDNHFVRREGVWTVAEMRLYPEMKADYFTGWNAPGVLDRPGPAPAFDASAASGTPPAQTGDLAAAETALARAAAFDAIEHISSAVGFYLNDSKWYELSRLFAEDGWRRSPQAGFYRGRDRIWQMQVTRNGPLRRPRAAIPLHLRLQPVIHVAPDGRSAKLRTRLLQFNSSFDAEGSMTGGMYEDRAVLERGVWRFELDDVDHIWRTVSYRDGWARVPEDAGERLSRPPARLLEVMPPDRPIEGPAYPPFPAIGRLPFHYRNPVSGRAPPDLLPD